MRAATTVRSGTYKGLTLDDKDYSNANPNIADPRIADPGYTGGGFIRHINGSKYLMITDNNGYELEIYKFATGSEIAVPYARFNRRTTVNNNLEIWVDGNANGILDSTNAECATTNGSSGGTVTGEETCVYPSPMLNPYQDFFTWYMDSNGNVWSVGINSGAAPVIYEYLVQGTSDPSWCYMANPPNTCVKTWSVPKAFAYQSGTASSIFPLRLLYDTVNDAMYITGYTNNSNVMHYNTRTDESKDETGSPQVGGGFIGTQILRYNSWSTHSGSGSANLTADCTITVDAPPNPPNTGEGQTTGNGPKSFDVAHGLIATENDFTNRITYYYAYDSNCSAGTVKPQYQAGGSSSNNYGTLVGPEVGAVTGTLDIVDGLSLIYLNDSAHTYVTFTEDSGQHKIACAGPDRFGGAATVMGGE